MSQSIAQTLKDARIQAGFTQAQLAAEAGTSQSAIARIERGASTPSLETLERLLDAMGFTLALQVTPKAEPAYVDPVVEAYKKDVDRTLILENLRLSVDERMAKAEAGWHVLQELERARRAGPISRKQSA